MSKIIVLKKPPVVFTKDREFLDRNIILNPGAIVVLPEDAVLLLPQGDK